MVNKSTYLIHHGIKGQKWGVRRYQNPDGSLTESGKKRAYKELKNAYKKQHDRLSMPLQTSDKTKEVIRKNLNISDEKLNEFKTLKNKWLKLENSTVDFIDSDQYKKATKKAYDNTYDWYLKNNKEYLSDIITMNGGEKAGLTGFHGFRKTYEGFHDQALTEAKKEYKKSDQGKARKEADVAFNEYYNCVKSYGKVLANDFLGSYGDKKLNSFDSYTYKDLVEWETWDAINDRMKQN